ncbi:MAG: AbrB/MazE/SpoVT family DNA-binding domain-containing protein [Limnochordaceae bacterium]|nr:AbrB/MazE/SpoVT family DNA-binding domain-containing protein [Limnochordaceae bacterium]
MSEHEPVFYGAVTVGERGQIVIPQKAREAHGIRPGDKILVLDGGMGHRGLVMIKAEALSDLLTKLSEHANAIEKLMRMTRTEQDGRHGENDE